MGDDSPNNKVKFLCSHAGKVLPRPSDGVLKYVGGETRVVSVPRQITFSELMKKLSNMIDGGGDMVLKYQLVPEDLDALVSVRNDEDLKHMIEEHDRHQTGLLRAFLFPSNPILVEKPIPSTDPYVLEQRYMDAINCIIRTSPRGTKNSACSSPKSISPDAAHSGDSPFLSMPMSMQRVRSSPSLTNLNNASDHTHYCPSRPPQDHQGIGKTYLMNGVSRAATSTSAGYNNYYYPTTRTHKPYSLQDDSAPYTPVLIQRVHSVPRSPPTWE